MAELLPKAASQIIKEVRLQNILLKNRVVMASLALKRCDHGAPNYLVSEFYTDRASTGLIITEGCAVSREAHTYQPSAALYSYRHLEAWKRVVGKVHDKGGKIFAQLTHLGRSCLDVPNGYALAPSPIPIRGTYVSPTLYRELSWAVPRKMTKEDIKRVVGDFQHAARNAWAAGFDGVQIDAGHGGLLDTFIRSSTNKRNDVYGGDAEGRIKFPLEVMKAVMSVYGSRSGMKLTPVDRWNDISDANPKETYSTLLESLNKLGVSFIELKESMGEQVPGHPDPNKQMKNVCATLRPYFKGRIIGNGGHTMESGNLAISKGDCDLISFGSLFLTYPDLIERHQQGLPTDPFTEAVARYAKKAQRFKLSTPMVEGS